MPGPTKDWCGIGTFRRTLNIYDGQEIEEFKTRDKEDYLSGNQIDNIIYTGNDTYWFQDLL